jgi:ribosomal protein S18 acetylase RimI-like enzyme
MKTIGYRDINVDVDYEFCRNVHHSAYREVVIRQFGSWDESMQDGFFREGLNRAPHKIVEIDGTPIGVVSTEIKRDCLYMSELQLLPEYQGQGIGSIIVKEQMAVAKSLNLPLRLVVLRENRAQDLYRRLGFMTTGTTEIHVKMEWCG